MKTPQFTTANSFIINSENLVLLCKDIIKDYIGNNPESFLDLEFVNFINAVHGYSYGSTTMSDKINYLDMMFNGNIITDYIHKHYSFDHIIVNTEIDATGFKHQNQNVYSTKPSTIAK